MTFWQWLGWHWHTGPLREIAIVLVVFLFWAPIIYTAWVYFPIWTQIILLTVSTVGVIWLKMTAKR